ncbi:MAG: SRPBCC family protein [Armatimonadetes bacterium]|nr:SRPBCC family protein [Armatimonadota bacterium]
MAESPGEAIQNRIRMEAPWRTVFELASEVERWPEFLPHYRWVRTLEQRGEGRVVEMAARRGFWPVKWTALLEPKADERRIYFHHLKGPARGMRVYWELIEREGGTDVTIHHELSLETPIIRTRLGKWIVTRGFIHPIAGRTLACMKRVAEGERTRSAREARGAEE